MTRYDYDLLRDHEARLRRRAEQHRLARTASGSRRTPDLRRDLGNALMRLGAWLETEPEQTDQGAERYRLQAS